MRRSSPIHTEPNVLEAAAIKVLESLHANAAQKSYNEWLAEYKFRCNRELTETIIAPIGRSYI